MRSTLMRAGALVAGLAAIASLWPAGAARADGFTVTTTADSNDGACTAALCSLRDAVIAANNTITDDMITLPAGHYTLSIAGTGEDAAATGDLDITDTSGITWITGAGPRTTIVDANGIDRVLDVLSGAGLALSGVTVTGGTVTGQGDEGGGIQNRGSLTITDSQITDNQATSRYDPVTASSGSDGGGIWNGGSLSVDHVTFAGNAAGEYGGALELDAGVAGIRDSTITGNQVTNGNSSDGGGVDINSVQLTQFSNDTIVGNSDPGATNPGSPGGVWAGEPGNTTIGFQNTIVADNSPFDCDNTTNSNPGNNLDSDGTCFKGANDKHGEPMVGPLQDNGGSTDTLALKAGSPAIDGGDDASCQSPDQRGLTRPVGNACDIGAYEFAPPAVTTGATSGTTLTSTTVSGTLTAYTRTASHFEYGTTTSYGSSTPTQTSIGNIAFPVSSRISGLSPGTVYHYRLVASDGDGTTFGTDRTFTTPTSPPLAVTGAVYRAAQFVATVMGTVNPNSMATTYSFQYGPTTSYSKQTSPQPAGAGGMPHLVTARLTALQPGRTYHYRLVATNSAGTTIGSDRTFTTIGRLSPRGVIIDANPPRDRRLPYHFTFTGAILLPLGVRGSDGCRGSVSVQIKNGRKTISNRRQKLSSSCTYRQAVTFSPRYRLGSSGRLKVSVRFLGNAALAPKTARPLFVRFG